MVIEGDLEFVARYYENVGYDVLLELLELAPIDLVKALQVEIEDNWDIITEDCGLYDGDEDAS